MKDRHNEYLILPESIRLTNSYEACEVADIIVISVGAELAECGRGACSASYRK